MKFLNYITIIMLTPTPWSLLFFKNKLDKNILKYFFQVNWPNVIDDNGFFPLPLKVPKFLINLFISVVGNNGVFFIFTEGAMIFFKFNQYCWQQWVLNVLDFFNYVMSLVIMGFWNKQESVLCILNNFFQTTNYHRWQWGF